MEQKVKIDRHQLIKILSIYADDAPKGMEILELFIEATAMGYASDKMKEVQNELFPKTK